MDYRRDAGGLYQSARSGICSFRRKLVWRRAGWWALRCFPGQGFLRRIHVPFEDGCVQGRSRNSRREVKELGLSLHRLADDDGTYDQARRQRVAAAYISQTITVSPPSADQAGAVANRKLNIASRFNPWWPVLLEA